MSISTPEERAEKLYGAILKEVGHGGSRVQLRLIADAIREAVTAEREACARLCEATHAELDAEFSPEGCTDTALVAADRIRKRRES